MKRKKRRAEAGGKQDQCGPIQRTEQGCCSRATGLRGLRRRVCGHRWVLSLQEFHYRMAMRRGAGGAHNKPQCRLIRALGRCRSAGRGSGRGRRRSDGRTWSAVCRGGGRRAGLGWSGCRCRFAGRGAGLCGVVVYIPAGALEVQPRCGERTLEHTLAYGANELRRRFEMLDFFKAVAALSAAIRIQRQSSHPSHEE